jgi:hypothetical protein
MNWIITPDIDPVTGDMIVTFPQDMLFMMDWREGDTLDYQVQDNQCVVRNIDAEARARARTGQI